MPTCKGARLTPEMAAVVPVVLPVEVLPYLPPPCALTEDGARREALRSPVMEAVSRELFPTAKPLSS